MVCSRLCNEINYNSPIVVIGLCENKQDVSDIISKFPYWKQTTMQEIVSIPDTSANIDEVNSANITINIISNKVIKTPRSTEITNNGEITLVENLAGNIVTGRKIIIEGQVCQIIGYSTSDLYDNLRSMTVYNPFSAYIVVPQELNVNGVMMDSLDIDFNVNFCVEDLEVKVLDCRRVVKTASILFYAQPNV